MEQRLLVLTGEHSGDIHCAEIIRHLKSLIPGVRIIGSGGQALEAEGMELIENIRNLAVIGFTDIFPNILTYYRFYKRIREFFQDERQRPAGVVLVDFAGFNLRIAALAKRFHIPVIYIIPPKVWAWNQGRLEKIRRYVDKVVCLFDFEEKIYRDAGVDVTFAGNPNYDRVTDFLSTYTQGSLRRRLEADDRLLIGILPGSREKEVRRILPEALQAARLFQMERDRAIFVVSRARTISPELIHHELEKHRCKFPVVEDSFELMADADFLVVKSGTSTLEAGLMAVPMAVVYKTSWLTYQIGKRVILKDCISLPNVVLGRKAVPELIQGEFNAAHLHITLKERTTENSLASMRSTLERIQDHMHKKGFAQNAAQEIVNCFGL